MTGSTPPMDPSFSTWLDAMAATAKRHGRAGHCRRLDDVSRLADAPHVLLLAGRALRSEREPSSRAEELLAALREHLAEGLTPTVAATSDPARLAGSRTRRGVRPERCGAALLVETLEYGTLSQECLTALATLARHHEPLAIVLIAFPPRPPAAQAAVLEHCRAQLRVLEVPRPCLAVWDPEQPSTLTAAIREVARELACARRRRLRRRLLDAHRGLLLDIRAARQSSDLDLAEIETQARQRRFEKERIEARLNRAQRELHRYLGLEVPRLARIAIDAFGEHIDELAAAAVDGEQPFADAGRRIAAEVRDACLRPAIPRILSRALDPFSREASRCAADVADSTSALGPIAGDLADDLETALSADQLLPLIRWLDTLGRALDLVLVLEPSQEFEGLKTALHTASRVYVEQKIRKDLERLREPLRRELAELAGTLADRAQRVLLDIFRPPIEALEVALESARRRLGGAAETAVSAAELTSAIERLEQIGEQLRGGRQ